MKCEICGSETKEPHRHHVVPKSEGGAKEGTVTCCPTCNGQVHILFTNKELAKMSLEELLETDEMKKYIKWRQKHSGEFKHRESAKVKKYRKYHRG